MTPPSILSSTPRPISAGYTPFRELVPERLPEQNLDHRRWLNQMCSNLPSTYVTPVELGDPKTAHAILTAPYPNVNISLIACLTYMIRSGAWNNEELYEELDALLAQQ